MYFCMIIKTFSHQCNNITEKCQRNLVLLSSLLVASCDLPIATSALCQPFYWLRVSHSFFHFFLPISFSFTDWDVLYHRFYMHRFQIALLMSVRARSGSRSRSRLILCVTKGCCIYTIHISYGIMFGLNARWKKYALNLKVS